MRDIRLACRRNLSRAKRASEMTLLDISRVCTSLRALRSFPDSAAKFDGEMRVAMSATLSCKAHIMALAGRFRDRLGTLRASSCCDLPDSMRFAECTHRGSMLSLREVWADLEVGNQTIRMLMAHVGCGPHRVQNPEGCVCADVLFVSDSRCLQHPPRSIYSRHSSEEYGILCMKGRESLGWFGRRRRVNRSHRQGCRHGESPSCRQQHTTCSGTWAEFAWSQPRQRG